MCADATIPHPSSLAIDANGDGALTWADTGPYLDRLFFLPGDWLIWAIAAYTPETAELLGVGVDDYHGVWAGFVSACTWGLLLIGSSIGYHALRDADRRLTRSLARAYAEGLRGGRMLLVLAKARWRRAKTAPRATPIVPAALAPGERAALTLIARAPAGHALTSSEVAAPLRARLQAAAALLERLTVRGLLVRAAGGGDGEDAYAITARGRAALAAKKTPHRSEA
jgi:hypothetical protein